MRMDLNGLLVLHNVLNSGATKPASTALSFIEILHLLQFSRLNLLYDDLCDTIMLTDIEIRLGMIKQYNTYFTAIVLIDHACTDLNVMLCSKT
jgi:hypothetical protein